MSSAERSGHAELVHLNGRMVSPEQARIPVFDYGFLYGYGLFETMRAYSGVIFRLEEHVLRLLSGAERFGFADKLSPERLADACRETLRSNSLPDARLRLTVTPGNGDGMPDPEECTAPTVLVVARNYVPRANEEFESGFSVAISRWKRCEDSAIVGTKSLSYAENLMVKFEAIRKGFDEALIETADGMLAEGATSNIFIIDDGAVVTPPLSVALPGIARTDVLNLAISIGLGVEERAVQTKELFLAGEAFLTNSIIEVMPITRVDGKPIGNGRAGPVTRRLARAYRDQVETAVARDSRR